MKKCLTIKEYIDLYIKERLNNYKYDVNDIYLIISNILSIPINNLKLENDILLDKHLKNKIQKHLDMYYIYNIPLQYINEMTYFFNEKYLVNKHVLIPRQDTEILVEETIKIINENSLESLLDLCTGSGCIGISISNNSNIKNVTISDISKKALNVAKKNIKLNKTNKIKNVVKSDMLKKHIQNKYKYDIIVSNPPYIQSKDILNLDLIVKSEPSIALNGGELGIDFYENIFENSHFVLNKNGYIILEIGFNQLNTIINLLEKYPKYEYIKSVKDYGGNDRVVVCRFLRKLKMKF